MEIYSLLYRMKESICISYLLRKMAICELQVGRAWLEIKVLTVNLWQGHFTKQKQLIDL